MENKREHIQAKIKRDELGMPKFPETNSMKDTMKFILEIIGFSGMTQEQELKQFIKDGYGDCI